MRAKEKYFKALLNVGPCTAEEVAVERYVTTQTASRNLDKLTEDDVIYKIRPPEMSGKYGAYDFFKLTFGQNSSKFWYVAKTEEQIRKFIKELIDNMPEFNEEGKKTALTKCIGKMLPDELEELFWHRYEGNWFTDEKGETLLWKAAKPVSELKEKVKNKEKS